MSNSSKYGAVWNVPAITMKELLNSNLPTQRKISMILQLGYFSQFTSCSSKTLNYKLVLWLKDLLLSEFGINIYDLPACLKESKLSPAATKVDVNGRLLSPDLMRNILYVMKMRKALDKSDSKNIKILEIGSGHGSLARVLKLFYPSAKFCLVDIPESLACAEIYLRSSFPKSKIVWSSQVQTPEEQQADFCLIPIDNAFNYLSNVNEDFDIAINIWSFGEMQNIYIKEYLDLIQNQCKVNWFFTINSFMAPVTSDTIERANLGDWLFNIDPYWQVDYFEIDPIMHRCPLVANFPKGIALLAKRVKNKASMSTLGKEAAQKLKLVLCHDWARYLTTHKSIFDPEQLVSKGNNISDRYNLQSISVKRLIELTDYIGLFNIDTSKEGAFFILWNDWRLNGSQLSGMLLICYIAMIGKTNLQQKCTKEELFLLSKITETQLNDEYSAFREDLQPPNHADVSSLTQTN